MLFRRAHTQPTWPYTTVVVYTVRLTRSSWTHIIQAPAFKVLTILRISPNDVGPGAPVKPMLYARNFVLCKFWLQHQMSQDNTVMPLHAWR